jgi:hypothetical protein
MLDSLGGVDLAVTTRSRCAWKKFNELAPFLTSRGPSLKMKGKVYEACVRSCMMYGCETWPMRKDLEMRMLRTEMRMVRRMCGVQLNTDKSDTEVRELFGLELMTTSLRKKRLRWFGHVMRKDENDWVKKSYSGWEVEGSRARGRPKQSWASTIREDLKRLGVSPTDTQDRDAWRATIRNSVTQEPGTST